ncbi:MAG: hypothetical protein Kow0059_05620 [Candidatus Sumerlaeia bacterium]
MWGNSAEIEGGALKGCDGEIAGNVIQCNEADAFAALGDCDGPVHNNVIVHNTALTSAIVGLCGGPMTNNTIAHNTAGPDGRVLWGCTRPARQQHPLGQRTGGGHRSPGAELDAQLELPGGMVRPRPGQYQRRPSIHQSSRRRYAARPRLAVHRRR